MEVINTEMQTGHLSRTLRDRSENEETIAEKFYKPSVCRIDRNHSNCVLQLRKTFKELQSKPITSSCITQVSRPFTVWQVFKRLSLAISFADSYTKNCMIFSYEERTPHNPGQRLFLVTNTESMWTRYKLRPPDRRHSYEIIRENYPCKLYFDLEFNKGQNPAKDGNELTNIFIKCIIALMQELYNLKLQMENFLWLDASTEEKFSSHLILQLSNTAFKNNSVAGSFVTLLISNIASRIENNSDPNPLWPTCEELKSLFVQKTDGTSICFCDTAVYTKNRNFRLYLSTKFGKNAPLLLSNFNQYVPVGLSSHRDQNELIFYDSLITYFRNAKSLQLLDITVNNITEEVKNFNLSPKPRSNWSGYSQNGSSPFPMIDNFILSITKDFQFTGFIRKWSYLEKEEILTYEIGNYRFCSNIGRHHKSNNIMLIVDMKRKKYYQKCHDPECRAKNYKSDAKPLPNSIASSYNVPEEFFDDSCFSQLNPLHENVNSYENSICNKESHSNDMMIDDSFFDESFPFTQLPNTCEIQEISSTNQLPQDEGQFFIEDNFVENISIDEKEFANDNNYIDNDKENKVPSIKEKNEVMTETSSDYLSKEDELMMAEAADVLECSFENDNMFSEETIF